MFLNIWYTDIAEVVKVSDKSSLSNAKWHLHLIKLEEVLKKDCDICVLLVVIQTTTMTLKIVLGKSDLLPLFLREIGFCSYTSTTYVFRKSKIHTVEKYDK